MISNPKLYAVVSHAKAPAAAHKRNVTEIKREKLDEFQAKKNIDRADAVLTRLETRAADMTKQIAVLQRRKSLALARAERMSDAILSAMAKARLSKVDGFHVSFATKDAPAALEILDANQIPPQYFRHKDPEVDKQSVKAALARGEEIGAVRLTSKIVLVRK